MSQPRLAPRAVAPVSLLLLGCLLAPMARAASDAPLRAADAKQVLRAKAPHEAPASMDDGPHATPETGRGTAAAASEASATPGDSKASESPRNEPAATGKGGTRLPGMSGVPMDSDGEDVPLRTGAWVAHGGLALVPVGGLWGATRVGGDTRLTSTASEAAAGMLLGSMPARLLFFRPMAPSSGRWMELEVVAFGAGLVLTPPMTALGTWGLGELAFGGSRDRGDAYLGALGGAAAGALLGIVVNEVLVKLSGQSSRLKTGRQLIALSFIGVGATVGYQWAGGGPRPDGPTR